MPNYGSYGSSYGYQSGLGPATRWLMIVNTAAFIIQVILLKFGFHKFVVKLYLFPANVLDNFYLWQLVTYSFFHLPEVGFPWHLLGNLIIFYFFSNMVETYYGSRKLLVCYFSCVIFAGLVYTSVHYITQTRYEMLGASGGLMGILMVAACMAPKQTVLLMFIIPMKMSTLVWIFVALEFYAVATVPGGGLFAVAHLGGFAFGYLFHKYYDKVSGYLANIEANMAIKHEKQQQKKWENTREEVDRLLEKISEVGMAALTPEEKAFLKKASKEYQE